MQAYKKAEFSPCGPEPNWCYVTDTSHPDVESTRKFTAVQCSGSSAVFDRWWNIFLWESWAYVQPKNCLTTVNLTENWPTTLPRIKSLLVNVQLTLDLSVPGEESGNGTLHLDFESRQTHGRTGRHGQWYKPREEGCTCVRQRGERGQNSCRHFTQTGQTSVQASQNTRNFAQRAQSCATRLSQRGARLWLLEGGRWHWWGDGHSSCRLRGARVGFCEETPP